ncbi:4Fe-4S dicluster domain-containing protein [Methanococcus aeolicus]|uniref:4Fe-4S dicluster domain-containing protein n=1 Tax=Methanococcus aeolicus TaxID=42879 RepID=UPI0021CAC26C|nr:4Fe-4S dicluster domain-containing protein [Methanococcus aeolicus]UXM84513.1 4Fe-4S dicluster domain-containing protein [Methanococcus aeolicus]
MESIYINPKYCIGCKNCQIYCAIAHSGKDNIFEAVGVMPTPKPRIFVEYVGVPIPIQCRHCASAPCMTSCPSNAIKREHGAVLIEKEKCIGCKACVMACPFGVMNIEEENENVKAFKCDLCNGKPACVEACKTGAIKYGDISTIVKYKRKEYLKKLL